MKHQMNLEKITLFKAKPSHLNELRELCIKSFYESFSSYNTEANMKDYLQTAFSIEQVDRELNNPESEFYFANSEGRCIGYLKINTGEAQTDVKDGDALEIERIYVLQEFQARRIGQLLFEKAVEIAKQRRKRYLWLGVWEKNIKAINFYKKNGFVEFSSHRFMLGDDEQTDLLMKLNIA